jgi:serine/threonine protein kinase
VMGTPQYLSPEQAEGRTATAASDVYALGVVAFECLVGRRPFEADSPVATALAHIREPVPALPARVPADLAAVVTRALSKKPGDRYADGAAFAAALRDPATAAVRVPPPVVPPVAPLSDDSQTQVLAATTYDAGPVAPLPLPLPVPTPGPEPEDRSNPWPLVLVVLLVVALAVVVTLLLTRGGDDDPSGDDSSATTSRTSGPTSQATSTRTDDGTVFVNEGLYVGQQVDDVEADLRALELGVERNGQPNDDPDLNGIVTSVSPSGDVDEGETIRVTFYQDAPEVTSDPPTTDPPTSEPTSEPTSDVPTTDVPTDPTDPVDPTDPASPAELTEGVPVP